MTASKKKALARMKGEIGLGQLGGVALAVVITVVLIAMGSLLLNGMQEQTDNTTDAYTIIGQGIDALSVFGDWIGLIVLIVVMVVVIVIIVKSLGGVTNLGS